MLAALSYDAFYQPLGFVLFTIWWILTLYSVALCQRHPNIPVEYRQWCNLLVLISGPWALAVLLMRFRYPAANREAMEYRDQIEGGPISRWFKRLLGLQEPQIAHESSIELCTPDGQPVGQVDSRLGGKRGADGAAVAHAKAVLLAAIEARTSDVLIDPRKDNMYSVRQRIDGVLEETEQFSQALAQNIINCLKIASRMDIAERRRAQDGSFMIKLPKVSFNCRISTSGTMRGPKAALRILDPRVGLKPVTSLGLRSTDLQRLLKLTARKSGMILVCGPTGSGKTTTLYSLLNQFDPEKRNLLTIEDPIEYPLNHATQSEVNEKVNITFSTALRTMLRQNPDVILVGEVRDQETAELAIQASNTGHLVLTTVHGNDSTASLMRLRDLGIPTRRLAGSISAALSQRLVRALCGDCKRPSELDPEDFEVARAHGLKSPRVYVPRGCDRCRNTGFHGRQGVFELLFVTREVDDCLSRDPSLGELREAATAAGMAPMFDHGMEMVGAGITTFEEVQRVCQED